MTLVELLLLLLVAAVAGALGKVAGGYAPGGLLVSIGLGFLGALLGSWLARALELPTVLGISIGGTVFPLIWAIVGAALVVLLLSALAPRRYA